MELLDHYVNFYEQENPVIVDTYITGLVALIREHLDNASAAQGAHLAAVSDAKAHFHEILHFIRRKKEEEETAERFGRIKLES